MTQSVTPPGSNSIQPPLTTEPVQTKTAVNDVKPSLSEATGERLTDKKQTALHERSITTANPENVASLSDTESITDVPEVVSDTETDIDEETLCQATETYEQKLDAYRVAQGERWLIDNHEVMMNCLEHPKESKNVSFKLFVMINGERHLLIPESKTLSKNERKQAAEYVMEQISTAVLDLPDIDDQISKIKTMEVPLVSSYNHLVNLGKPPRLSLEEDILSMGLRIECMEDQSLKVTSYYPDMDENSAIKRKNETLDFQGFDVLTDPPDIDEDFPEDHDVLAPDE